jgi:hypothetical protein
MSVTPKIVKGGTHSRVKRFFHYTLSAVLTFTWPSHYRQKKRLATESKASRMSGTQLRKETRNEVPMPKTISRDELKEKIDRKDDFRLVETLPATAYHHNHLPGAINLPPDDVTTLAPQILPDRNADIVVYCASPT